MANEMIYSVYIGNTDEKSCLCSLEKLPSASNTKQAYKIEDIADFSVEADYPRIAIQTIDIIKKYSGTKYLVVDQTNVGTSVTDLFLNDSIPVQPIIAVNSPLLSQYEGAFMVPKIDLFNNMLILMEETNKSQSVASVHESPRLSSELIQLLVDLRTDRKTVIPRLLSRENKDLSAIYNHIYRAFAAACWYAEYQRKNPLHKPVYNSITGMSRNVVVFKD